MVCAPLDRMLSRLAREHRCLYSRYCDDLTFSTSVTPFPSELASREEGATAVGARLARVIKESGFNIHPLKVNLMGPAERKEVTHLVVNKKVNVRRSYIRSIRGALYAWRQHGLDNAAREFRDCYDRVGGQAPSTDPSVRFRGVLWGRIGFVGQIRGSSDELYRKLLHQYLELDPDRSTPKAEKEIETQFRALWILESEDGQQGTGFALDGIGIVTCFHVTGGEMVAFQHSDASARIGLRRTRWDPTIDLAVFTFDDGSEPEHRLNRGNPATVSHLSRVRTLGFPNYRRGDEPTVLEPSVSNVRTGPPRKFVLDKPLISGSSGGPVLDESGQVIAVIDSGAASMAAAEQTENHTAISIDELDRLEY